MPGDPIEKHSWRIRGARPGWKWALAALGMAIAVVPLALEMARSWGTGYLYQSGDQAIIETGTRAAAHFTQLLGPYDRFGWHHPGPAYFYLLSLPYHLLGPGGRAETVGEVGIVALAALAVVVAVGRRTSWACWLWAGLCMAVLCRAIDFANIAYVWNPLAVIVPTTLVVVLGALALGGSGLALVGVAVCGTICVQTDVATAPLVALVALGSVAGVALGQFWPSALARALPGSLAAETGGRPSQPPSSARTRAWGWALAAVGIVVFVGLWVPPVVQEVSGPGAGNLGKILAFFTAAHRHLPLHTGVHVMAAVDAMVALGPGTVFNPGLPTPLPGLCLAVGIALGLVAAAVGWRRRQPLAMALGVLSLAGTAVSVLAFTRIVGGLYGYLVAWAVAMPIAALLGIGVGLLAPGRTRAGPLLTSEHTGDGGTRPPGWGAEGARRVATVAVALAGLALMGRSVDAVANLGPGSNGGSDAQVATAWAALSTHLRPHDHTVLVDINGAGTEGFAVGAGLVDRLDSLGIRATVPLSWSTQFGLGAVSHGHENLTVVLGPAPPAGSPAVPGAVELRSAGLQMCFERPGTASCSAPAARTRPSTGIVHLVARSAAPVGEPARGSR